VLNFVVSTEAGGLFSLFLAQNQNNSLFLKQRVAKSVPIAADGSEHIVAFLFPEDVFGLAEGARYTNSTRALTPVTAFQIAVPALRSKLTRDAALDFHVICKLCQELREAQQHSVLLARRQALPKLAAFLQMLERHQSAGGERGADIYLPMNRSEIGEYVGLSLEAVSRAFRTLARRGVVKCRDRRHLTIADRGALNALCG
jgi:CRP/FNR family transcriptional regulator, anaerobic regulatory protein